MDVVGGLKVWYVRGWAVRKVLARAGNYIQRNVYTNSSSTLSTVETNKQRVCKLLEENIVQSFDYLQEKSNFQETLQVTEARQCRQRGLLHISDYVYLFFMQLGQEEWSCWTFMFWKRVREYGRSSYLLSIKGCRFERFSKRRHWKEQGNCNNNINFSLCDSENFHVIAVFPSRKCVELMHVHVLTGGGGGEKRLGTKCLQLSWA